VAGLVERRGQRERRDADARATRDRLAALLSIPPGELRSISKTTAEAMIFMIQHHREQSASSHP